MKITYVARKVTLRDNFKERVERKLQKFEKIFSPSAEATVVVTLEKNRQTVEVTIKDNSMVYRAESTMPEMNDALDKVADILSRQLRKHKTRLSKRLRTGSIEDLFTESDLQDEPTMEDEISVVRKKQIPLKPISVEEAILQMEMTNHKFYMFTNADTGETNVVYIRDDGAYGLLEPATAG
ncbi:MAG: ribosome-associated translation inhibitor RaiA [Ruminococcaceae bacterium]|nr:ribosome-associated translation inhibitor RaiA [Oscillospiraceae bacterium]